MSVTSCFFFLLFLKLKMECHIWRCSSPACLFILGCLFFIKKASLSFSPVELAWALSSTDNVSQLILCGCSWSCTCCAILPTYLFFFLFVSEERISQHVHDQEQPNEINWETLSVHNRAQPQQEEAEGGLLHNEKTTENKQRHWTRTSPNMAFHFVA